MNDVPRPETVEDHEVRLRERFVDAITHLDPVMTDRGFAHLSPVASTYGGHVRAYESSAALAPHVWLTSVAPSDLNDPASPAVEVALHLTLDGVRQLAEQLAWLVGNHYQNRPTEPSEGDHDGKTQPPNTG